METLLRRVADLNRCTARAILELREKQRGFVKREELRVWASLESTPVGEGREGEGTLLTALRFTLSPTGWHRR